MTRRALLALGLLSLGSVGGPAACRPELGPRESLVTTTQVLAVRGEPPEAAPGEAVSYSLLVATPDGPRRAPLASWAYCTSPKLLTENGAASAACLGDAAAPLAESAATVEAAMPANACATFGPEVASADLRPRDPDVSGGFYQPVRVTVAGGEPIVAVGLERIACRLANASDVVTADFAQRYVKNTNPELASVAAAVNGNAVALDAIPRGGRVTLRASWSDRSPERYVAYDPRTRSIADRRESLRVSWFATDGTFESDRTGRGEDELETFTENAWNAPGEAKEVHLFVVLRDDRGGVAFSSLELVTF